MDEYQKHETSLHNTFHFIMKAFIYTIESDSFETLSVLFNCCFFFNIHVEFLFLSPFLHNYNPELKLRNNKKIKGKQSTVDQFCVIFIVIAPVIKSR